MSDRIFASLDMGSCLTRVLIAEVDPCGMLNVKGVGVVPSGGLKQGVIVDMDAAVQSIREASHLAEKMAGESMPPVDASFSGAHIQSLNSAGTVALQSHDPSQTPTVTEAHIQEAHVNSSTMQLPIDKCLLHVVPKSYSIDKKETRRPLGHSGFRFQAMTHLVLAGLTAKRNLERCIAMAGLRLRSITLTPLAAAPFVMKERDLELGSILLDIGGGTVDALVFLKGVLVHAWVFPLAGQRVTRDVAHMLQTSIGEAESLKREAGSADPSVVAGGDEIVTVKQVHTDKMQSLSRSDLSRIIEARFVEVLHYLNDEMKRMNLLGHLEGSVVVTGGSALMPGLTQLVGKTLEMDARLGQNTNFIGPKEMLMGGDFAPSMGLLLRRASDELEFDASEFPILQGLNCATTKVKRPRTVMRRILEPLMTWSEA
jgi:cell division protein FtsA